MRKLLSALLCLLLLTASAGAELCLRMEEGAALVRADGTEIVPMGVYADIVSLGDDAFAARAQDGWVLLDAAGMRKSDAVYAEILPAGSALIGEKNGRWGWIDANGTERSAFLYGRIIPMERGGFWALEGEADDAESDPLVVLDANGACRRTDLRVRQTGASGGSEDLLPVLLPEDGLWGYCDAQGALKIPARYAFAGTFVSGCAAVVQNGRYGAIDAEGATVVEALYDYLEISTAGFILAARAQEEIRVFSCDGATIAVYTNENSSAMCVGADYAICEDLALSVYDAQGTLRARLDPRASVSEGWNGQLIVSDGMWGEACVSLLGIDGAYQNLYPLARTEADALYAFMEVRSAQYMSDLLGEIQRSADMESARYGVVSGDGRQILPAQYRCIEWLGEDRLLARTDGAWQMIDLSGAVYWTLSVEEEAELAF